MAVTPPAILRVFAELAPASQRVNVDVTAGRHPLVWLGLQTGLVAGEDAGGLAGPAPRSRVRPISDAHRLAAVDALHEHERLLREGWVYVVGTGIVDGERRRVCHPLLSRPVVLSRTLGALGGYSVMPAGDLEITPLITDSEAAARLEADAQFGGGALESSSSPNPGLLPRLDRLIDWVQRTAKAAALPVDEVVDWTQPPQRWRDADRLVAVIGAGLHLSRDVSRPGMGDVLRAWSRVPGTDRSAFARLYCPDTTPTVGSERHGVVDEVRSPLPLSPAQCEVVRRARTEPVVAVSGAPGNGKSHVVAAIAIDAVARGHSVLIATPSPYAADVIGELLYRQPGPDPVLFGSSASRREIAANLADGVSTYARAAARAAARADEEAARRVVELEELISDLLSVEAAADEISRWEPLLPSLSRMAPGVFAPGADLDAIATLVEAADRPVAGWFAKLRRRRATARVLRMTGAMAPLDLARARRALAAARSRRAVAELAASGGTRIGPLWDELFAADAAAADALGTHLRAESHRARVGDAKRMMAVTGLSAALRSGRAARREQLRLLDGSALTAALPLWIGALTDIDDLLPPQPRLFDLVILDEASQIDQPRAAPALLRADRAVIVGDPRQLRHVSFVADTEQRRVLADHGLAHRSAHLDVRRVSAFDAAAAVTAVSFLDEHHRGVPHLIRFSDRRFYGGRIKIRTRHPANESVDAIRVVRVAAADVTDGANSAEVAVVASELDRLATQGVTSVGVISPFRAQADALEAMMLERFDVDDIKRLGLRVGTVHAFQGAERDVIVLSLGLAATDGDQRRRFVADPNLCNVMVTRARRHMVVVTSLNDPGDGILADFLAHAEDPPAPPAPEPSDTPWIAALGAELERQGTTVRRGYRVGSDLIDLVIGNGDDALAVDCRVAPGGAAAHIAYRRALHRSGWSVTEAWASRYDHDAVRAALDLSPPP